MNIYKIAFVTSGEEQQGHMIQSVGILDRFSICYEL